MIPQIELTEDQMDSLCSASYQLLQAMGNIYGSDPAYEMFQKLEEVLGQDVKSHLFLKMLDSTYASNMISFSFIGGHCTNAINMIRAARSYGVDAKGNNLGLKEAKDIIDDGKGGCGRLHFKDASSRNSFVIELKGNNGKVI